MLGRNLNVRRHNAFAFPICAALCLCAAGCGGGAAGGGTSLATGALDQMRSSGRAAYGRLPLSFAPNVGQASRSTQFMARAAGVGVSLGPRGLTVRLSRSGASKAGRKRAARSGSLGLGFVGARRARPEPAHALPGRANYLLGNDRSRWRTGVPTFGRVRYRGLWPGVDAVFYGTGGRLEHDFLVTPQADPRRIAVRLSGANRVMVGPSGNLLVRVSGGSLRLMRPRAYQVVAGREVGVPSRFVLGQHGVLHFALGRYDRSRALVIDPVLVYSTYLGGTGVDRGRAIAVDTGGSAYVTGHTISTNFPTASPNQPANAGDTDVFVAKLNPSGSALVYSTYLGGGTPTPTSTTAVDQGKGIAVDATGNAYLVGGTSSTDFPTTAGAFQTTAPGGFTNAFVTKLNPGGSALLYSTYLGGTTNQSDARAIALDGSGKAYVTGQTNETTFPTKPNPGVVQPTTTGAPNNGDGFVSKFDPTVTGAASLVYSTYLGGTTGGSGSQDAGQGIAVDGGGSAYVTGFTDATNFPGASASILQSTIGGGLDAFLAKINSTATTLSYSTYLGGTGDEQGHAIAIGAGATPSAYVTGQTASTDFPTTSPLQPTSGGGVDAFVTQVNAGGTARVYSTYLGGSGTDIGRGIAIDAQATAHVAGQTGSPGAGSTAFPTVNAVQGASGGGIFDAFVSNINTAGSALLFSTYLGGSGDDQAHAIALDGAANPYIVGQTSSSGAGSAAFPTANAIQGTNGGATDAFVAKLGPPGLVVPPTGGGGSSATAAVQCADGRDNDGDGATDKQDPGCLSGPNGSYNPADTNEADESLGDLVLCGRRQISLVRADLRGKRVILSGLVASKLARRPVAIFADYGPGRVRGFRKVATVRPDTAGQFTASLKRPPAKLLNKARFRARVERFRSISLRLPQSLASTSVKKRSGQIEVRGKVRRSQLGKRNPVVVRRILCGRYQIAGRAKPDRHGNYVVRFKAPGLAAAALYRAEAMVLARPGGKRYVKQYARAIGITLTGQTG